MGFNVWAALHEVKRKVTMGRPRGGRMKNVAEKFKRTSQKKAPASRRLLMKVISLNFVQ